MSRWLVLAISVLLAFPATAGITDVFTAPRGRVLQMAQTGGMSLEQATQAALRAFPGRVARAETRDRGGRRVHEIRILGEDGRVRSFRFDATSGREM